MRILWLAFVGLFALFACSQFFLSSTRTQLTRQTTLDSIPLEVLRFSDNRAKRLAVIRAHGYDESQGNMRPLAQAFAQAGYVVVTFDFSEHGANRNPFPAGDPVPQLAADLDRVVSYARTLPSVSRVALLGHSMGANAIVPYAMRHPDVLAAIDLSGNHTEVTSSAPKNLLLLVGADEVDDVKNDQALALQNAGGAQVSPADFAKGQARTLVTIDDADHFSVLEKPQTFDESTRWLDRCVMSDLSLLNLSDPRLVWASLCALTGIVLMLSLVAFALRWPAPRRLRGYR